MCYHVFSYQIYPRHLPRSNPLSPSNPASHAPCFALGTLVAVRGAAGASCKACTDCDGYNVVDGKTGNNAWHAGAKTNQTYLILTDAEKAGKAIDQLLCQPPKHQA